LVEEAVVVLAEAAMAQVVAVVAAVLLHIKIILQLLQVQVIQ
jgi:hypothetical protein